MDRPPLPALPIDAVLPALLDALDRAGRAVLVAPPGAGKTTRVPLALLDAPWSRRGGGAGRILMLEPRRLAARAAAAQMARLLGEMPGGRIGYRTRFDSRVGPETRVEVVTEGVLTRMIQADPGLDGVTAILFDEFHERSLAADLGLALSLDLAAALRPDLRLLVMSATLDATRIAALLDDPPVIACDGRSFPVETVWRPAAGMATVDAVADAVRAALAAAPGGILAFLPGAAEIREVAARLSGLPAGVDVRPLYGDLPADQQDAAIAPAPSGRRKIVLATNVAETSLTIEDVRIVVDSGLARAPRFDARTGMSRLETVRISRAEADQRRGRAGRTAPGLCWRLWPREAEGAMPLFAVPEILAADLAPLALELAVWGAPDPAALRWIDPPPEGPFARARALLGDLGALDAAGRPTAHGRAMAALPAHPRLAHMLLRGRDLGLGRLGAEIAALLDGRRPPPVAGTDLREAVEALRAGGARPELGRLREVTTQLARRLRLGTAAPADRAGVALALAYPDRIAQARGVAGAFRLANGRGVALPAGDPLARCPFLAVAEVEDSGAAGRIRAAAPIDLAEIEALRDEAIATVDSVAWDEAAESVVARRQRRLGALILEDAPLAEPDPEAVLAALLDGLRRAALRPVWSEAAEALRRRVVFARACEGEAWPDWSDTALIARAADWLGPFLAGIRRRADLARVDCAAALRADLGHGRLAALDALAPARLVAPSGRSHAIDYTDPAAPAVELRLQEMFGSAETPRIGGGRMPVTLRLLSPAGRPLQVTRDLAAFWSGSYAAVRREMRGRYPKHPWPEDPLAAPPTARAKPRGT